MVTVTLKNSYAESIFSQHMLLSNPGGVADLDAGMGYQFGSDIVVWNNTRAQSDETIIKGTFIVPRGGSLGVTTTATSLGENTVFTNDVVASGQLMTIKYEYDYDLALAKFRLVFGTSSP